MLKKIKDLFEFSSKNGLYLPHAFDAEKKGPSITLLFANTAHYVAIGVILFLAYKDVLSGAYAAIGYSAITMVLYMMRRITSFKADLDDRSIELDSQEEKKDE